MQTKTSLFKKLGLLCCAFLLLNSFVLNAQIRLVNVDPFDDEVTIKNFGASTVDISGYWFCVKRTYASFATATIIDGSLNLTPNSEVTLAVNASAGLDNVASDVSIYLSSGFGTASNMVDFMQYGDSFPDATGSNAGREGAAVSQGLWVAGTFILGDPAPWDYTGNGTQNGVDFWSSETLSSNDEFLNRALAIYPNPVNETLNIKNLQEIRLKDITFYDMTGRQIVSKSLITNFSGDISLKSLNSGIYTLRLSDLDGRTLVRKLIKQ